MLKSFAMSFTVTRDKMSKDLVEKFIEALNEEDMDASIYLIQSSGLISYGNQSTQHKSPKDSLNAKNECVPLCDTSLDIMKKLLHEPSKEFMTKMFRQAVRTLPFDFPSYLLEEVPNKIDVNAYNAYGLTALHTACRRDQSRRGKLQQTDIEVMYLLQHGADINAKSTKGSISLNNRGDDPNEDWRNAFGKTALHFAVQSIDSDLVKLLLNNGADIHATDDAGSTCLHFVRHFHSKDDCHYDYMLLDAGANCNAKNNLGMTPLYCAAKSNDLQFVKTLLQYGADVNIMCNDSLTPLNVASKFVFEDLKKHVIAMECLGLYVRAKNLKHIDQARKDCKKFEECKEELLFLRNDKIGGSDVSFFEVLTGSTEQLAIYAQDVKVVEALDTVSNTVLNRYTTESIYPLFNNMLLTRFVQIKDIIKENLIRSSLERLDAALVRLFGKNLPEKVAMQVIKCYSDEELKNSIKKPASKS